MFKITILAVALILISSPVFGHSEEGPKCFCPLDYQPLCGSNGITYPNQCQFICAQSEQPSLSVFSQGVCPAKDEDQPVQQPAFEEEEAQKGCLCSFDFRPVCGSDGKTYGNPCMLSCAAESDSSLTLSTYGSCKLAVDPMPVVAKRSVRQEAGRCFCTREFRPVCGSNGRTYSNKCEFACAQQTMLQLQIVNEGQCEMPAENKTQLSFSY